MSNNPKQTIYKYAFWLSICGGLLGAIICYYIGSIQINQNYKDQYFSIGANLLSSVIFASLFSYLSNEALLNLFKDETRRTTEGMANHIVNILQNTDSRYSPTALYFPTDSEDNLFNEKLSIDLKNSTFYLFKGISAKYVPIRIKYTAHNLSIVKIIILNPLNDNCISLRIKDRQRNPKYKEIGTDQLTNRLKLEIYKCIVALYDVRNICPIEICLVDQPCISRLEIFDSSLYLSLYHTPDAQLSSFPESLRFDRGSLYYTMYRMESFRTIDELYSEKILFNNHSDEQYLFKILLDYGMVDLTPAKLSKIRKENKSFGENFINKTGISNY